MNKGDLLVRGFRSEDVLQSPITSESYQEPNFRVQRTARETFYNNDKEINFSFYS